jgi:hypothetical protein
MFQSFKNHQEKYETLNKSEFIGTVLVPIGTSSKRFKKLKMKRNFRVDPLELKMEMKKYIKSKPQKIVFLIC